MTRILLAALVAALGAMALYSLPAHAQADSAPITTTATATGTSPLTETVIDLGNNIYGVDATKGGDLPALMSPEDIQKIATLQSAPGGTGYKFLRSVSPDDEAVLVRTGSTGFGFLDLRDGSISPVQVERLAATTNYVWLDDNTVGFLTTAPINMKGTVVGASIDRRTGEITYDEPRLAAIAALNEDKRIVTQISSDLSKVLRIDSSEAKPSPLFQQPDASWDTLPPNDKFIFAEGTKLEVVDVASGEVRDVMQLGANPQVLDIAFSPDGSKFSVTTMWNEWSRTMRTTGGPRLTDITYQDVTGTLPLEENPYFLENKVTVLDFPSGEVRELRAADGDGSVYGVTSWSPDNKTLMVKVDKPGQVEGRQFPQYYPEFHSGASLRFYDADLNEVQRLEQPAIDSPEMRAEFVTPNEVLIETRYGTDGHPCYYNLSTGEFRDIGDRPGVYHNVTPTNHSREIAYVFSSYTDPPEFYRANWDGTGTTQLTSLNADVKALSLTTQHPVSFTLSDGSTFDGVLILPADVPFPPQNVPIVVWQAGGPAAIMANSWQSSVESPQALLPNFGIGVLVVPIYGRYGVGPQRFSALVDGSNFGEADIDVQAEIAEQLRARGWADKVGIAGCSYGGYFVLQSIIRHPNTYDAAHSMCAIADLILEWNTGDGILAPYVFGKTPWEAPEEYRSDSPIYQADEVRTPLLAFKGTQDFLPADMIRNFVLQVVDNGVPAKMLLFQAAAHNFASTPAKLAVPYALYGAQEQILWFQKYLGQ